ncbi:amidohydrolase family protein [Paraburkholderia sediminicola]|uniref:amidohydrolase family protein n=1 Tax=Paraburkholderia sediminicola TaxID=458836 RepID=UPI0038BD00B6
MIDEQIQSMQTRGTAVADQWYHTKDQRITAIDAHAHVFVRGLPLAQQRRHAPDYDATVEAYAGHLLSNGVSHAVLVQPSFLGTDNSFFLDVAKRYPRRFRGVAVVDCAVADNELALLDSTGVVGIRLNLVGLKLPQLTAPDWRRLFARVNALGWHVEVHRQAVDLHAVVGPLLEQGCTVVVDHFGRPDPRTAADDPGFKYLLSLAATGRVWVKLSAAYRSAENDDGMALGTALASQLLDAYTPARLVWGSDWPHTQHQQLVDYTATRRALDQWVPDAAQRASILTSSARTLYRFE